MSEPSRPRPVPGPPGGAAPRPVPASPAAAAAGRDGATDGPTDGAGGTAPDAPARFADLGERPVAEHVDAFEAEHARLERELRTIDQL
ncbi:MULTISPECIES: hypothetical protein [unclassified Blastococcus]